MFFCRIKPLRRLFLAMFILASATTSISVNSQTAYPNRPIKLITPFPPGGSSDVLARLIATKLGEGLGQTVTVDNRAGASGNIGHDAAAKSLPDGYTLLLSNSSSVVTNPHLFKKLPFDPLSDFASISMVASAGQVLVVHPSVPVTTLAEVTAYAKANPNKLNFGSGGKGIQSHISGEMYKSAVGVDIVHVPYKGTAPALNDLMGGSLQMLTDTPSAMMPHVRSGKIKALAVFSNKRVPGATEVPTIAEAGGPAIDGSTWVLFLTQAATPKDVVNRMSAEAAKAINSPELRAKFESLVEDLIERSIICALGKTMAFVLT